MFNSKPLIFNKVSGDKSLNKPFKTRIKSGQSLEISKSKDYTQSDFRYIKNKRPSNTSSTTNSLVHFSFHLIVVYLLCIRQRKF